MKNNKEVKTPTIETQDMRDSYLGYLNEAINKLHHKAVDGKVRNPKTEKIKIEYFRALIYAVNTANTIYKDKQLDKLERDMESLKNGLIFNEDNTSKSTDEIKQDEINKIDDKIDKLLGECKYDFKK